MTLRLDNNSIVSLEPLAGAAWLSELSVDQNPLQGLQGLEDLELGDLSAEAAGLTSLVAVAPTRLRFLRIADNHVTDLAPLAGHTWLQEVHATGNDISSLASIAEAPWVLARCAHMDLEGNPLDAETLTTFLPEMCALDMFLQWDGDSCMSWNCPS
jgi:Leucine-rich repeat (LRR) protein